MAKAFCRSHILSLLVALVNAQSISTSTPLPPLQWINLSNLLQGPAAPPLKDVSIGYDETSRSLLIFGGESEGGFVQDQTYLLNLQSLTWSTPSPPSTSPGSPAARSAAISGDDFAASNRHGHVVIGGKGTNGKPLSDIWEYDYINQFWGTVQVSPGGPSPRWGASGGIDFRVAPIPDVSVAGPNNTIYLAGGYDGDNLVSLSDVWELRMAGTLSSNLPNSSVASWQQVAVGNNMPPKTGQATTVISQQLVSVGGCNTTAGFTSDSCSEPDSFVANTQRNSNISPNPCPAPRLGAALAPNMNSFSSSFASQAFLLLGTFNSSLWQDDGGLAKGEVAVLDVDTGAWSRVLPAGDPGTSGTPAFPSPREGAAAISFSSALVGSSRTTSSDTIVFGGRDANGKYLAEVWLLRAYNDVITSSGQKWSGFGNGALETGANANGAGVTLQYLTSCASAIAPVPSLPSSTSSHPSTSSSGSTTVPAPSQTQTQTTAPTVRAFDTSVTHKSLAPVSIALFLPAILLFRLSGPSLYSSSRNNFHNTLWYTALIVTVAAYGIGIGGLASSFTSIQSPSSSSFQKRSSPSLILKTGHGKAGLALFICLYGLIPILYCLPFLVRPFGGIAPDAKNSNGKLAEPSSPDDDAGEKSGITSAARTPGPSPPASPRPRLHSWGPSSWTGGHRSHEGSTDGESVSTAGANKAFEVLNRPTRVRHSSANGLMMGAGTSSGEMAYQRVPVAPRNLGDVGWLERRRSLNAVGELDYAQTQANRAQGSSTPATTDMISTHALMTTLPLSSPLPSISKFEAFVHILTHLLILGLCALTLVALWMQPSRAGFGVFLAWTVVFYAALFTLAWHGYPQNSLLTIILTRLRQDGHSHPSPVPPATPSPRPLSAVGLDQYPFPTDSQSRSPYTHHHPPYRAVTSPGHDDVPGLYGGGPRSVETDIDDDDEDEDSRQRRIEEEMDRRDVSIVTVPKRKLRITNLP